MTIRCIATLLLAAGCMSAPPPHPEKIFAMRCETDSLHPNAKVTLRFAISNAATFPYDICVEQLSAHLRSDDGSDVRMLGARTTLDSDCPEPKHVPVGGEVFVELPAGIPIDSPRSAVIEGLVGISWPPGMRTTPENARFELKATCGKPDE